MGGFELTNRENWKEKPTREDDVVNDEAEGVSARTRTWRHWLVGLVGFLYFSGMNAALFLISQYIYQRIQIATYPNKTFVTGISYCAGNKSDPDVLKLTDVQQKASDYNVLFSVVAGVPSIFFNIVLGSYTDRFGRKFLMIASTLGTLIRVVVSLIGVYTFMDIDLFAIGFAIEGALGQAFAYLLASYAYISDITTRRTRAIGIVFNEVCIGLGLSLPTFVAGYFLKRTGFKIPMIVSGAAILLAIFILIVLLPESYPKHKRKATKQRCTTLRHSIEFYYASWNYGLRWKYTVAILVFYLTMVNVLGRTSVETLYQMNTPFCWDSEKLSLFTAVRALLQQAFGMISIGLLKLFMNDETIALVGCISMSASFVIEGLAKSDLAIYLVTVVGSLGMLAVPMVRSIMSRMTASDKQGALAAGISAVETICHLTSAIMLNSIYRATVATTGGAVFFFMASLTIVCFLLLIVLKLGSDSNSSETVQRKSSVRPISYSEKQHL